MENTKTETPTVSNIVRIWMTAVGGKQISLRRFTKLMNKPLVEKEIVGVTHQAVYNWLEGKSNPSRKSLTTLKGVADKDSWQYKFASDLLVCMDN